MSIQKTLSPSPSARLSVKKEVGPSIPAKVSQPQKLTQAFHPIEATLPKSLSFRPPGPIKPYSLPNCPEKTSSDTSRFENMKKLRKKYIQCVILTVVMLIAVPVTFAVGFFFLASAQLVGAITFATISLFLSYKSGKHAYNFYKQLNPTNKKNELNVEHCEEDTALNLGYTSDTENAFSDGYDTEDDNIVNLNSGVPPFV